MNLSMIINFKIHQTLQLLSEDININNSKKVSKCQWLGFGVKERVNKGVK
jgi:hypothetical protein